MSVINFLHLSFGDCLVDQDFKAPKNTQVDVYYNNEFRDYVNIKDTKKSISIPIMSLDDRIQIIFQSQENKEKYGSITFTGQIAESKKSVIKWVTLKVDIDNDVVTEYDSDNFWLNEKEFPHALFFINVNDDPNYVVPQQQFQPVLLDLSFGKYEMEQNSPLQLQLQSQMYLNSQFIGNFNPFEKQQVSINSEDDKLKLVFVNKNQVYGSLTLPGDSLLYAGDDELQCYITLFDDPDDDEYDGDFKKDDLDFPRVQLQLELTTQTPQINEDYPIQEEAQEQSPPPSKQYVVPETPPQYFQQEPIIPKSPDVSQLINAKNDENSPSPPKPQVLQDPSIARKIADLLDQVKEKVWQKQAALNAMSEQILLNRQKIFAKNLSPLISKYYDLSWLLTAGLKDHHHVLSQDEYADKMRQLSMDNDRLASTLQTQKQKRKDFSKLEHEYIEMHKKYNRHLDKSFRDLNLLQDQKRKQIDQITNLENENRLIKEKIQKEMGKHGAKLEKESKFTNMQIIASNFRSKNLKKVIDELMVQLEAQKEVLRQQNNKINDYNEQLKDLQDKHKKIYQQMEDIKKKIEDQNLKAHKEIKVLHDALLQNNEDNDKLQGKNDKIQKENDDIRQAIADIKQENENLLKILNLANEDLKQARIQKAKETKEITDQLQVIQSQLENEENLAHVLQLRIDLLTKQKHLFRDIDLEDRINNLEDQLGGPVDDERLQNAYDQRLLIKDAIDAAYKQWVDQLNAVKDQILDYNPDNTRDLDDEIRKLNDNIYETQKIINELKNKLEKAETKYSILKQRQKMNEQFYMKQEDYQNKIQKRRDDILELKKKLKQLTDGLLNQTSITFEQGEMIGFLIQQIQNLEKELERENELYEQMKREKLKPKVKKPKVKKPKKRRPKPRVVQQPQQSRDQPAPQPQQPVRQEVEEVAPQPDVYSEPEVTSESEEEEEEEKQEPQQPKSPSGGPIKFIRLGEGTYNFGSKVIRVRVLNGKLVIRVGGGYLMIDEFLKLYTLQELDKLRKERAVYKVRKKKFKHGVYAQGLTEDEVTNLKHPNLLTADDVDKEIVFELRTSKPGHKIKEKMSKNALKRRQSNQFKQVHIKPSQLRKNKD